MPYQIPDYQDLMLPLLAAVSDGESHSLRALTAHLADQIGLTADARSELLPSGQQTVIGNRIAWAKTYLKKAGLVDQPGRGLLRITTAGRAALAPKPARIDNTFLRQYPAFLAFYQRNTEAPLADHDPGTDTGTPEEVIDAAYKQTRQALADELLDRVKACSPRFFERLVVDLLVTMGYGGSVADAGQAVGRTGDGGIDGIIKQDKLGLDVIRVQAKRWEGGVCRPVVQVFAGSMEGVRARKGVLITTSTFSKEACEYVTKTER